MSDLKWESFVNISYSFCAVFIQLKPPSKNAFLTGQYYCDHIMNIIMSILWILLWAYYEYGHISGGKQFIFSFVKTKHFSPPVSSRFGEKSCVLALKNSAASVKLAWWGLFLNRKLKQFDFEAFLSNFVFFNMSQSTSHICLASLQYVFVLKLHFLAFFH